LKTPVRRSLGSAIVLAPSAEELLIDLRGDLAGILVRLAVRNLPDERRATLPTTPASSNAPLATF